MVENKSRAESFRTCRSCCNRAPPRPRHRRPNAWRKRESCPGRCSHALESHARARAPGLLPDTGPRLSPRRSRSEEHTSELQSRVDLVCRLLLEKKKKEIKTTRELL